jgi:hypothetical protein
VVHRPANVLTIYLASFVISKNLFVFLVVVFVSTLWHTPLAVYSLTSSHSHPTLYRLQDFAKTYAADEAEVRREIFAANLAKIQEHNSLQLEWTMGVNQ